MAFPVTYRTINRLRVTVSVLASAVIHAAVLLLLEYFGIFTPEDMPKDFEPLVVQIGSLGELDLLQEEADVQLQTLPSILITTHRVSIGSMLSNPGPFVERNLGDPALPKC